MAAQSAMGRMTELTTKTEPPTVVGPPLTSESHDPAVAWQTAAAQTTENLTPDPPTQILVGPVNWVADVQTNPDQAWRTAVVVDEGLAAGHQGVPGGGLVKDFGPGALTKLISGLSA
jgi:malonyl CoA-acyl carrier protein transacylase